MAQVDPKDLDYSPAMVAYFTNVVRILIQHHEKSEQDAKGLIARFFALDVHPLERALVMHRGAERVARDLAHPVG